MTAGGTRSFIPGGIRFAWFRHGLILSIAKRLWDRGLPVIDDILAKRSHSSSYEERKTNLISLLREMKPGITEIIFHCSLKTDESGTNETSNVSGPGVQDMGMGGKNSTI